MPTFTAIVTAHQREDLLRRILGVLSYQTRPPDETLVLASNIILTRLREDFPEASFFEESNREDWGHEKRARGVALARGDFLGFFNHDDLYSPSYIEKMLCDDADVVFCNWNGGDREFHLGSSTSGNFIVRSGLARQVGYLERAYEADGHFINALCEHTDRIVKVNENLYTHNP